VILADSAIWIDHLRQGSPMLSQQLNGGSVVMHSMVIGELACGSLKDRTLRLAQLRALPRIPSVTDVQALAFIEWQRIMNRGLSFIDVHLLAAVAAQPGMRIWTRDRRLNETAQELDLAFSTNGI